MSAFCVHGVTRSACLATAKKKVDIVLINGMGRRIRLMSEVEWGRCVGFPAAAMFSKAKSSAVSPRFDAPQFARQWMDLSTKSGDLKDGCLMALAPTGEKHPKTHEEILRWMPYALVAHKYEQRKAA